MVDMHTHRENMRAKSLAECDAIMRLAGFTTTHMWELANDYWPAAPNYDEVRTPWWLFLTEIGPVQIGRRKNVLHIQWDACTVRGIVTDDDVTKCETYVHAWKPEKAVEYLRALRCMASAQLGPERPEALNTPENRAVAEQERARARELMSKPRPVGEESK
jgi:hypothetical protein